MKVCPTCRASFDSAKWQCPDCGTQPESILGFPAFAPALSKSNRGFKSEYFEELALLEEKNFWFQARNRLIVWALRQYFQESEKLLEIGCGTGYVLSGINKAFPQMDLYGSEIFSAGLVHAARRTPDAGFFQMDGRAIPYRNEFDVIGAFDILEHIVEDQSVLHQMHGAVKTGGGIVITVPQHKFMWSKADEYACHVRRYAAIELKEKVMCAGFQILRISSFVSLLLPFMMISRRLSGRQKKHVFDPLAELKISGPINSFFEKCLDFERFIIRKGISFPFGGSLLLIARKV